MEKKEKNDIAVEIEPIIFKYMWNRVHINKGKCKNMENVVIYNMKSYIN